MIPTYEAWSVFLLFDDGTWVQPTYRAPAGSSDEDVRTAGLNDNPRAFLACAPGRDDDCPQEHLHDWPRS